MSTADNHETGNPAARPASSAPLRQAPDWAEGLKQLYDAVVDEPLPDSFHELLHRLDRQEQQ